jgi:hypothetical protein
MQNDEMLEKVCITLAVFFARGLRTSSEKSPEELLQALVKEMGGELFDLDLSEEDSETLAEHLRSQKSGRNN